MAGPRRLTERRGWAFSLAVGIVKPLLLLLTHRRWVDGHCIPSYGGAVIAANHVSHLDPLTFAHFLYDQGRLPRYLAKAVLFDIFFVGTILRSTGQIPVHRLSEDASQAFSSAVEAVRRGRLVVVYPEGTLTRQPELWPMRGRTGAARIALSAGVPVIPVAQWGAQDILYPYTTRPRLLPRKTVQAKAGPEVYLDDLRDRPITPELLREATDRIMDAVTRLLEDIRAEAAPTERFDPRQSGLRPIGNPHGPRSRHRVRRRTR
ncbi:MAG: Acyl-CoA:1-acyl-sn-glycerol-3-phosphate acyltransferase [uncultured Nocardioidaceae bacterium]|uniref:Acyl-CoA:1-acyl-sn-glycerol-3-phosphate acyltransferase n=1 Tax=uncultured Nocardioidaceae bacterium TaxID=253824 RepID=A0A6J4LGC1_9ACTN|nr:MAG: Acyl-CoA:1-acyl-sn-glycerol-3-phosphate acyltransferase [uncultured Nocardioidaceae bacterium]